MLIIPLLPFLPLLASAAGVVFGGTKLANFAIDQKLNRDRAEIARQTEADIRHASGGNEALARRQIEQANREMNFVFRQEEQQQLGEQAVWIRYASYGAAILGVFAVGYLIRAVRGK